MIFLTVRPSKVEVIEEHSSRQTNVGSAGGTKIRSSKIAKSISNQKAKYRTGIWFFARITAAILEGKHGMEKKFSVKNSETGETTEYSLESFLDFIDIAMAVPGAIMVIEFPDNSRFVIKEVK